MDTITKKQWTIGGIVLSLLTIYGLFTTAVAAGTVKAGYLFGRYTTTLEQGFHFPVNPLVTWHTIDCRQKTTFLKDVKLPSRDQLTSAVDLSVQYRAVRTQADIIVSGTGTVEDVVNVHLLPKIRSAVRNAGRTVEHAEDLFTESEVSRISDTITVELREFLATKGLAVEVVLIRNIDLPKFVDAAIQKKKMRDQRAEEQKAELRRFETEQQQKVASAEAERKAAVLDAQKIETLAKAEAFRIKIVNAAVGSNPAYIQLQALDALRAMAKDPAAKLYIMDGSSMQPIPFLNLGAK